MRTLYLGKSLLRSICRKNWFGQEPQLCCTQEQQADGGQALHGDHMFAKLGPLQPSWGCGDTQYLFLPKFSRAPSCHLRAV